MQIPKRLIIKNLKKKGFEKEDSTHHLVFVHKIDGVETGAKTYVSHSPALKDYGDDLISEIITQVKLNNKKDTVDLLTCPLSAEKYIEKLKENGTI